MNPGTGLDFPLGTGLFFPSSSSSSAGAAAARRRALRSSPISAFMSESMAAVSWTIPLDRAAAAMAAQRCLIEDAASVGLDLKRSSDGR